MIPPALQAVRDTYRARELSRDAFLDAVLAAHDAGYGYGTIAAAVGLRRSTVSSIVYRSGRYNQVSKEEE